MELAIIRFLLVYIILTFNFIVMPLDVYSSAMDQENIGDSNLQKFNQENNDWTTGVEVGSGRKLTVIECDLVCDDFTPLGTNITHIILAKNSTQITYQRILELPNGRAKTGLPTWIEGIFMVSRKGYIPFPKNPSLAHPFTTNNTSLLEKIFNNSLGSRKIAFEYLDANQFIIKEKYLHEDHYDDYVATFNRKTGWLVNFDNIIRGLDNSYLGHVKEDVIFEISPTITTKTSNLTQIFAELIFLLSFSVISILLVSVFYIYKIRKKREDNLIFVDLLKPEHRFFIKKLYTKVVLALTNYPTAILNSDYSQLLDQTRQKEVIEKRKFSIITNLYPEQIQKELKSEIRGRTILILVELAYQPYENKYSSFLSKELNIPPQTITFEIKKLIALNYLKINNEIFTLKDTRFKYYELTGKGISFLHLIKESIAVSLVKDYSET